MSQIKKRVKTGHKRTGTKTKSDIKRKTGMVERLVLKLCRPHYLFLQAEKTISHRTKILSIKNAHFMKNYYLVSYESIKLQEISIGKTSKTFMFYVIGTMKIGFSRKTVHFDSRPSTSGRTVHLHETVHFGHNSKNLCR